MDVIYYLLAAITFLASFVCLIIGAVHHLFIPFGLSGWLALLAVLFTMTWRKMEE